ncbi:MAG TPA: RNA methyltransferase [Terriglobia bacterium]|nr:RNA methyltransferase [Terriglobia bacterium]
MQIGKHNRKLVEVRKAFQHDSLTPDGLLPIEGPILLEEAHRSGIEIVDLFFREGADVPMITAEAQHELPADLFKSVQDTEHSQGLIATVRPRQFALEDILTPAPALIVVLARLQDPGNVGTILRVAESFGATGCIALAGTAGFYNSKVVRASAGSVFRLPHMSGVSLEGLLLELRRKNVPLVGTAPAAERTIDEVDWRAPAAVLIGNEGNGLSSEELTSCDRVVRIPHKRTVESLNSAIAAAVLLYEASKQRLK